ncbi:M20 family metallo-hydrolase [Azospirillum sp.]|uniref:M20 family metallo-hydrolase n=1 Tax=Azospirillum sp. TaxID=34012 RepID=UPI002D489346|nr:M20 family metallo-hydrolase [Azospirillum sp.]HYD65171.1 M20 family metallo-hydrolase [Azospirillum sp.]
MGGDARSAAASVAAAVREDRLWQRLMDMAAIGARPDGGVDRPALSPDDAAARSLLASWAREQGFSVSTDPIGNLFVRRAGREGGAAPVLTGSHLDTQPMGGKFDGAYGVMAGFEALQAMNDAGIETRRPVELVAWTNEEGSRFQPGCMGSQVFAGALPLEKALVSVDRAGTTAREALAAVLAGEPEMAVRDAGLPVHAYIEAHIEQGPVLEEAGLHLGVVTGIQGYRWFAVEVLGEAAHAGTTPRARRRDAFMAAHAMVGALRGIMEDAEDVARFTIGRFEGEPGSPNTVPSRVFFTIDLRHPEQGPLTRLGDAVEPLCRQHAGACEVRVTETFTAAPLVFDAGVLDTLRTAAGRQGIPYRELPSGAGHDAAFVAKLAPAGMLFVPCARGVSHHPAESATPADLATGTRVLAEALAELANR